MDKLISAEKYKAHLKKDFMDLPIISARTKYVVEMIVQLLMRDIDLTPAEYPINDSTPTSPEPVDEIECPWEDDEDDCASIPNEASVAGQELYEPTKEEGDE